ncbi:MAG: Cytoskeleton protein RodZ [Gammaproteobacteria bacterium]|nr:Cytoskeleton protein RodZ [Gammaproteobacteria bacterium]
MNARAARDETYVEEATVSSLQQLGERLRQAREAHGLNVQDIAARLHLSASVVATIENGAFEQLPAATYARGYMRAYAHLVGLNPESLLAAYDQYATQPPELNPFASTPQPQVKSTDLPVRMVTYAVIAIVVGLLGAWLWQSQELRSVASLSVPKWGAGSDDQSVVTEPVPTGVSPQAASAPAAGSIDVLPAAPAPPPDTAAQPAAGHAPPGAEVATGPAEVQVQPAVTQQAAATAAHPPSAPVSPDGASVPVWADTGRPISNTVEPMSGPRLAVPPAEGAATATPSDGPLAERSMTDPGPLTPAMPAVPEATPGGAKVLSFELAEDAWLEVTDAEDKRLYYNMGRQGSRISVQGVMPYRVKVGNAPAVSVSFEGRPLDISAFSYESVARFSVTPDGFLAQP